MNNCTAGSPDVLLLCGSPSSNSQLKKKRKKKKKRIHQSKTGFFTVHEYVCATYVLEKGL